MLDGFVVTREPARAGYWESEKAWLFSTRTKLDGKRIEEQTNMWDMYWFLRRSEEALQKNKCARGPRPTDRVPSTARLRLPTILLHGQVDLDIDRTTTGSLTDFTSPDTRAYQALFFDDRYFWRSDFLWGIRLACIRTATDSRVGSVPVTTCLKCRVCSRVCIHSKTPRVRRTS